MLDPRQLVGAVVVTYHDGPHVAHLLRRLAREVAEVVVVDLGSGDDTVAVVERTLPGVAVDVIPTAAGYGAAFNTGMRLLEQPYALLVHGDARPRPEAVWRLLEAIGPGRRRTGAAGARITSEHGKLEMSAGFRPTLGRRASARLLATFPRYTRHYVRRPATFVPNQRADVGWVSGALMMVNREAYDAVGGMDEGYFLAYGAMDFCLRLRRADWRVVHEPRARAIHLDRVEESWQSVRRSRVRFEKAHGVRRHLRRLRGS